MIRILKYCWFYFVMWATGWMPDLKPVLKLRGFLVKCCFKKCGKNFQIASGTRINFPSNIEIGNDVFIANYCWLQGIGGIVLEDEVMLGPFTVLATNNHTRDNCSWRFGKGAAEQIILKRGSWTGAHAVITSGVIVGEGSAIAAGAVVTKDIPADVVAGGIPANVIKEL